MTIYSGFDDLISGSGLVYLFVQGRFFFFLFGFAASDFFQVGEILCSCRFFLLQNTLLPVVREIVLAFLVQAEGQFLFLVFIERISERRKNWRNVHLDVEIFTN